jgi:hypothetical protein
VKRKDYSVNFEYWSLLDLFIIPSHFLLVETLGGLLYIRSCHLQPEIILLLFKFFSCLIALSSTSSAMLNRSRASGHPCLVYELRRKLPILFHHVSCVLFINTFIVLEYLPLLSILLRIFSWKNVELYWNFFSALIYKGIRGRFRETGKTLRRCTWCELRTPGVVETPKKPKKQPGQWFIKPHI